MAEGAPAMSVRDRLMEAILRMGPRTDVSTGLQATVLPLAKVADEHETRLRKLETTMIAATTASNPDTRGDV